MHKKMKSAGRIRHFRWNTVLDVYKRQVTRYFGGTLLGTGGLVRAYTQAVKEGLKSCIFGVERFGYEICVETDYNGIGRIQYLLGQRGIQPSSCEYTDVVRLKLVLPVQESEELHKAMVEATNGRVIWEKMNELYFVDKE